MINGKRDFDGQIWTVKPISLKFKWFNVKNGPLLSIFNPTDTSTKKK